MIPMLADLTIETTNRRVHLWLPLFLIWLLLLPLVLLLLPFAVIACVVFRINPLQAIGVVLGVIAATSGTEISVERPRASFFIRIV